MKFDKGHGYESLALNIVIQAAKDYRKALKKLRKDPEDYDAIVSRDDCEQFFRSAWCETITSVDPEILMKKLQREEGYDGI
ncbi:MAG: hypothetical protein E7221_02570 [Clostridiales bacterium]|nr:hypothetical protein [Clostridiales bacterium]MBR0455265.1 hypothetical protein [Bacillota bacterium]